MQKYIEITINFIEQMKLRQLILHSFFLPNITIFSHKLKTNVRVLLYIVHTQNESGRDSMTTLIGYVASGGLNCLIKTL